MVQAILRRGHTVDQLSTEELKMIVNHIDKQQKEKHAAAADDAKDEKTAAADKKENAQEDDDEDEKKDGEKKETKEERRKRLHARNMRYYRSLESGLDANLSL